MPKPHDGSQGKGWVWGKGMREGLARGSLCALVGAAHGLWAGSAASRPELGTFSGQAGGVGVGWAVGPGPHPTVPSRAVQCSIALPPVRVIWGPSCFLHAATHRIALFRRSFGQNRRYVGACICSHAVCCAGEVSDRPTPASIPSYGATQPSR